MVHARKEACQFGQRHLVDVALEFDHDVQRHPVLVPAPGVELRVVGGAQVHVGVAPGELQQEPDLLLAAIVAAGVAADELVGDFIAQPVTRASHDPDMLRMQPHFLMELAEHRLLGRLAVLDPALRELPRVGTQPLSPKNLILLVEQDDADVGPEAFTVEHNETSNSV